MSRTNEAIKSVAERLDRISGLDGIVTDYLETLDKKIALDVEYLERNHGNANLFNYYGENER